MTRVTVLAILVALAWSSGQAFAQEPPSTSTISGRVVNGTAGAPAPAGLTVELNEFVGAGLRAVDDTTATDDGTFEFENLSWDGTKTYVVLAIYAGVVYESDPLQFADGQTDLVADFQVYETTDQKDDISITFQHLVAEPDSSSGHLVVVETVRVENSGDRTFVGREPKHEGMAAGAVRFTAPEGAHGLELIGGISWDDISSDEVGFFDTRPLPPGSREIAYSYGLEQDSQEVTLSRILDYPTTSIIVLAMGEEPPLSPLFADWESTEYEIAGGQTATYYQSQADGLTPATPLEINFRGLPPPPPPVSDASDRELSLFIGALGLIVAVGFVVWTLARQGVTPPVTGSHRGA